MKRIYGKKQQKMCKIAQTYFPARLLYDFGVIPVTDLKILPKVERSANPTAPAISLIGKEVEIKRKQIRCTVA